MNQSLIFSLNFNNGTFMRGVQDLSKEDSLRQVIPEMNPTNWIAGHIVATRAGLFGLLGLSLEVPDGLIDMYKRGSAIPNPDEAFDPKQLVDIFSTTHELLMERFRGDAIEADVVDKLMGFFLHESYHIGQLGNQRRFLQKPTIVEGN